MNRSLSYPDPRKHSSMKTFNQSPWLRFTNLPQRVLILIVSVSWIIFASLCAAKVFPKKLKHITTSISFSMKIFHDCSIPLHTLLICEVGIDRIYMIHILFSGIAEFTFTVLFSFESNTQWIIPVVCFWIISYVWFYIPTRTLYHWVFDSAKNILGIPANYLLWTVLWPWFILTTFAALVTVGLILFSFNANLVMVRRAMIISNGFFTSTLMIFELYMYSKINPLKQCFTMGTSWKEILYLVLAVFIFICSLIEVILIAFLNKQTVNYQHILRVLVKIIVTCRYFILWLYCLDEIDMETKIGMVENRREKHVNVHGDIIDLSKFTQEDIAAMEVRTENKRGHSVLQ